MTDIELWMSRFAEAVQAEFGGRIVCIGLQGSRARGEAAPQSDIDTVVILDKLSYADLQRYRRLLAKLEHRELICGFISGRDELYHWSRSELFQFYHDTRPMMGSLDFIAPLISETDIRRAIHEGACGIYHACAHNALHERDIQALKTLFKSAFFVLQAKHYLATGLYISRRADLLPALNGLDSEILESGMHPFAAGTLDELSEKLFRWSGMIIRGEL